MALVGGDPQLPSRINDELLSCAICFCTYSLSDKQPKLLPCSHTFCIECIGEYLKSQVVKGKPKGKFPCPTCRRENVLPKNGITDLPNNITVLGLLDLVSESGATCTSSAASVPGGVAPSLYPQLPGDVDPYAPPVSGVLIPVVEQEPDKCYECAKPKPTVTFKCGHQICKACKKKRKVGKAGQTMCPMCTDLQAASMLLAGGGPTQGTETAPDNSMDATSVLASAPTDNGKVDSPMEADRPPSFNPGYDPSRPAWPSAPTLQCQSPTRAAPRPPKPARARDHSPGLPKPPIREASPGGRSAPPPPPPRRLPGEILGSPLKCIKKIGSYSDVRMQTNTFQTPSKISLFSNGNFLVVDEDLMTVQVFNEKGDYLSLFRAAGVQGACFYTADKIVVATRTSIEIYSINGTPTGQRAPCNLHNVISYKFGFIAIHEKSFAIYNQDLSLHREIKKKVRPGMFNRASSFEHIQDVAITTQNDIAVLDSKAGEIYLLNEEGHVKLTYTPSLESCGSLKEPFGIAVDRYNNLYVSDTGNKRVLKFYANGRFARCVLNFALGNPTQKEVKTTVYGLASGAEKHIVMALRGDKTAEVRLYEV